MFYTVRRARFDSRSHRAPFVRTPFDITNGRIVRLCHLGRMLARLTRSVPWRRQTESEKRDLDRMFAALERDIARARDQARSP
jgi:hypothetical protein